MSQNRTNGGEPRSRCPRLLIVSFDIARVRDPVPSLAVGSLIAFARAHPGHGRAFEVLHTSFRMDGEHRVDASEVARRIAREFNLRRLSVIALAAYAWSESLIDPLMRHLRDRGFAGDFVVGGYQVTQQVPLDGLYPAARYLVEGPAERELLRVLLDRPAERVLVGDVSGRELVSPYLSGVIDVPFGAPMVRIETQRGCRWRCRFCSYRGLREAGVAPLPIERVAAEIRYLADRHVEKLNVLDPEFNARRECLDVLRAMVAVGLRARVTVQARPENLVRMTWAGEFLDLCEQLDIHLEFGLQTAVAAESETVNRRNDLDAVSRALTECHRRGISHEVSLIFGLPLQTVASFAASLDFVMRHKVPIVRCFPLMLHRGTALSLERDRYALREEVVDNFDIPLVTSSSTFTKADWNEMSTMASHAGAVSDHPSRVPIVTSNRAS